MKYFPFTFLFNVPGISNPFSSSTSTSTSTSTGAVASETSEPSDTKRLKRNFDASVQSHNSAAPYHHRPPRPSRPQPAARLVRKNGWQPSSPIEPSQAAVITPFATGVFNTAAERSNMNSVSDGGNEDEHDVLDLPPAKKRKGLAESVISTAFNAALVGAAVGLTVFRLWTDKGKEGERTPPPPYQEDWSPPPPVTTPETPRVQKPHAPSSAHKRHAGSLRHRPKVVRKTVHIRRDIGLSPNKPSVYAHRDELGERNSFTRSPGGDDPPDEMDWIGERLSFLIEEGKRALGTEVVVASESPEDEVDDGSGNWVEVDERDPSTRSGRARSKRSHNEVEVACSAPNSNSASLRLSSFPSLLRFHSDDLSASLGLQQSTPIRSSSAVPVPGVDAATTTPGYISKAYESESPSIRESMERARAAYLQKRGLGIHTPET